MPFDIARSSEPLRVTLGENAYEVLDYTGTDDGLASLFHTLGYLLTDYGLFRGDAEHLRRLIATTAIQLFEGGAREVIQREIGSTHVLAPLPYFEALAAGQLPGDRVCLWAVESHFGVRVELLVQTETGLLPLKMAHFHGEAPQDTLWVVLRGAQLFRPLSTPDVPELEAENYCLTCGVGVPHPLESICDDCVRRPRFCVSCGITYVESGGTCVHCTTRLRAAMEEDREQFVARDVESYVLTCGLEVRREPPVREEGGEPSPRPKFVVYLSNAPFDDFRSGDGTYINALVNWLNAQRTLVHGGLTYDVASYRVCDAGIAQNIPFEERGVARIEIPYIRGWPKGKVETEKMTQADWQGFYEPARKEFLNELAKRRKEDKHPQSRHIFHAQVRYPDSGALFNLGFFRALASLGFEVVVTCHEMKFNLLSADNMQRNVVQLNDFVACADRTIFLNEHDLMCGVKLVAAGSLSGYMKRRTQRKIQQYEEASAKWREEQRRESGGSDNGRPLEEEPPWLQALGGRASKLDNLLKGLRAGDKSEVHPSGASVDTIAVSPRRTESFFHIPGIATVKGIEFDAGAILRRPPNVLVFGLIKQADAMEQTADVAREILSNPRLGDARVYVVGKVFKDFKHTAIATLVGKMCGLSNKNTETLSKDLDRIGDKTETDLAFYEAMKERIGTEVGRCRAAWAEHIEKYCVTLQPLLGSLEAVRDQDVSSLGEDPIRAFIQDGQAQLGDRSAHLFGIPYDRNEVVLRDFLRRVEEAIPRLLEVVDPLDKQTYARREFVNGAGGFQVKVADLKKALTNAKKAVVQALALKAWPQALLPIEIHFDAPPDEFQRIAGACKYAFKVDQKSMADNASSIISLMSNGCITFTESRYDTPSEYYKDHGGALSPVIMPEQKYGTCSGAFVVQEILRRESERDAASNRKTLKNMQTLLSKRYGLEAVASKHLTIYKTFLS